MSEPTSVKALIVYGSDKTDFLKKYQKPETEAVEGEIIPGKNGGWRPGAGRPKGSVSEETKLKNEAKKEFEKKVARASTRLFNAQMSMALGVQVLYKRYRIFTGGKPRWSQIERVTDPDEAASYLNGDFENDDSQYFMLTLKDPDLKAIDSLLDRSFGKAAQSLSIKDDRPDPIETILKKFNLLEDEGNSDDAGQTTNTP